MKVSSAMLPKQLEGFERTEGAQTPLDTVGTVLLEDLLRLAVTNLGSASGDIALRSRDRAELIIRAAVGPLSGHLPIRVSSSAGISGRVLRRNDTEVVENVWQDAEYRALVASMPKGDYYGDYLRTIRATVKTPLRIGDSIIGILCVHWEEDGRIPANARELVEAIARQISSTIHHAAREAHTSWFDRVLDRSVANGVDLSDTRRELYRALAREAIGASGASWSNVRIYDMYRNTLRFVAWTGVGWTDDIINRVYVGDSTSAGGWAASENHEVVINDVKQTTHYRELFPEVRSHVTVPITSRGRVVAILSVDADHVCAFTPDMVACLNRLAHECCFALEHLALIEDTWLWDFEKRLASVADAPRLCDIAMECATRIFGVRGGSILLQDPFRNDLHFMATLPTVVEPLDSLPRYAIGEGLTGWVLRERQVLRLRNTEDRSELRLYHPTPVHVEKWYERIDYESIGGCENSFLAAPLLVSDGAVGVMRLTVKENGEEFTADDEVLIRRFCSPLALAVHNARLRDISQQVVSRLEALHGLSSKLAATLDSDEIAAIVIEDCLRIVGAQSGHIRLFDKMTGNLRLVASAGPSHYTIPKVRGLGEGISGRVAQMKKALIIDDASNDATALAVRREDTGLPQEEFLRSIGSEACYPLLVRGELAGTVTVHWSEQGPHNPVVIQTLELIANRAAVSLQASLVFRETDSELKRKLDWLARIRTLASELAATRHVNILAGRVVQSAATVWDGGAVFLCRLNEGGDKWIVMHSANTSAMPAAAFPSELNARCKLLADAARSVVPTHLPDVHESQEFRRVVSSYGRTPYAAAFRSFRSAILVPLRRADRCLGLLILASPGPRDIPTSTLDFLQILAGHAAIAFENANLLNEKEQQLKLAQPFAILGAMLSGFEHTMRGGIQRISGCLQNLERRVSAAEDDKKYLTQMQSEVDSFFQIIREIELFARGDRTTVRERIDVNKSIAKVVQQCRMLFGSQIEVLLQLSKEPVLIRGHHVELEQAFIMVINNAVEAMPNGGKLTIETTASGGQVTIRFTDTGVGMNDETRKRAMDPFFTTKRERGGTGMGLPVVVGVITRHSGTLQIDTQVGRGTSIEMLFSQEKAR